MRMGLIYPLEQLPAALLSTTASPERPDLVVYFCRAQFAEVFAVR
jgi:hypothetical protein